MNTFSELPPFQRWNMLPLEERPRRQALAGTCAALIKALLQTSYYAADHPQARLAVQEPWQRLQELRERLPEITFVTTWADEVETVALEGVFADQVPLGQILLGANAGALAAKLHTFCARARVVSLSVKTAIGEDEFHRFVCTFVERHVGAREGEGLIAGDGGHWLGDALLERGVVHVSVLVEEDLVEERRKLPWRVRLALTRLRKDLRAVPLYRLASAEERRAVKLQVLQDIMRPLGIGGFLHRLFANVDLIAEHVVELQGFDLEHDLVAALNLDRLLAVGDWLLGDWARGDEGAEVHDPEGQRGSMQRLLVCIGTALGERHDDERASALLRRLEDQGAVPLAALPEALRTRVVRERWARGFLGAPADHLERVEALRDPEAYGRALGAALDALPDLIRDHRLVEARLIVAMVRRHQQPGGFPGRREKLRVARELLDVGEAGRRLVEVLRAQPGDELARALAKDLLVTLGPPALPLGVAVLGVTRRLDVANDVAAALVEMGAAVVPELCRLLDGRHVEPRNVALLLRTLGHIGAPGAARTILGFVDHPRPQVRDAALEVSWKLGGARSHPVLVKAVADADPTVAIHAIRYLEQMGHNSRAYLVRLLALAEATSEGEEEDAARDNVRAAAIAALARRGDLPLGDGSTTQDRFLALLPEPSQGISRLAVWRRREPPEEPRAVRQAAVDALGVIGDLDAAERLDEDSGEPDGAVRERMQRAAQAIRLRSEGGA